MQCHLALYNLKDDIREQRNLAEVLPEKRDELLKELHRWQDEVGAIRPTEPNPEFNEQAERRALERAAKPSGNGKRGKSPTGNGKISE